MQQIKVYISAKLEHAAKLAALRFDGIHINSRWIEMADAGRKRMKPVTHWQQENFDDIDMAHFVILYLEPGDHLKGSLFEIGYAIRAGKKVWIAGDGHGVEVPWPAEAIHGDEPRRIPHKDIEPWCHYRQQIRVVDSLETAILQIKQIVRPDAIKNVDGSTPPAPEF